MKTIYTLMAVGGFFLIQSCASADVAGSHRIQKRKYTKGWHIGSGGQKTSRTQDEKVEKRSDENSSRENIADIPVDNDGKQPTEKSVGIMLLQPSLIAEDISRPTSLPHYFQKHKTEQNVKDSGCDNIMLKNGEEIQAKVTEIGTSEIKYKKCDNLDGPTYTLTKREVFKIKYANGTSALISEIGGDSPLIEGEGGTAKVLSILSLVFGILGLSLFAFAIIGLIFSLAGLGLSIAALSMNKKQGDSIQTRKNKSFATWGMILSIIGLLFAIGGLILFAVLF